ncbi:MAG: hypothetical protein AMK69_26125 [Nitrospira bacterium SG8_3]|nr:MAG: hypothetical protein AMK69_26125 [Nitrospira bacterium SG8_3]
MSIPLPSLGQKYQDHFPIGFLIQSQDVANAPQVITQHSSMVTVQLYFRNIHPEENTYNFTTPDALIDFAYNNGIQIRGHSLIGGDNPINYADWLWVDENENGNEVTREVLIQRMRDHIHTVVGRYQGKVACWDVVNEATSDLTAFYNPTDRWREIIGIEYVDLAFQFAHEADPDALLFYNEYNIDWNPFKRLNAYNFVQGLLERNVPIHGIGLQGRWLNGVTSVGQLLYTIDLFSALGLQVQITELDMSVYPGIGFLYPGWVAPIETFTEEMAHAQAETYDRLFEGYRSRSDSITGIIFWGIRDEDSWLRYYFADRLDWPLLFEGGYQPKYAFWAVADF